MRSSQASRAGYLAERERWLRSVQVDGREELLFELEMLLRGVERYFNLHNITVDARERPLVTRDFREELADVRDAINHCIRLARQLLDPDSDQKMVFRKYVESQLADDRVRRALLEEALDQDSPQESLFVLRQSFDALRTVIDHLLKLPACALNLFTDVGNLALREIVLNRYFRPFRPLEFRIEYDRIKSVRLLELLAEMPETDRPLYSTAFLALFRVLHYLSYVEPRDPREAKEGRDAGAAAAPAAGAFPRRVRVVLALVRSEAVSLVGFLNAELAPRAGPKRLKAAALRAARDLAKECERISRRVLVDLDRDPEAPAHAAAAFRTLFREQVVALAAALGANGHSSPEDAFEALVSPEERAHRLRQDLWVFAQLCRATEGALRRDEAAGAAGAPGPDASDTARRADAHLAALGRFLADFHAVSYQLLRYGDFEPFDRFAALLTELPWPPEGPGMRQRLAEDLRLFGKVLESTFRAVSRRALLRERAFERAEAEALRDRYLPPPA
ncbi:hypothetical protein FGE12_09150 [Aggregicoccus sp. 17bor-14]|uniref:hypothetical protein n=1 Tax=Myxococcaceae TaxID=31 RepID=UPI00129C7A1D|nr:MULTISPECIES: hypothetical protein [Myxococcaceae]MBF5042565.1 hypothetical protein [Simulacricoccus sp. 17bor-14]MRI88334.1 hypothetical protein [Aggregicoccus sp. 17bor-14]